MDIKNESRTFKGGSGLRNQDWRRMIASMEGAVTRKTKTNKKQDFRLQMWSSCSYFHFNVTVMETRRKEKETIVGFNELRVSQSTGQWEHRYALITSTSDSKQSSQKWLVG